MPSRLPGRGVSDRTLKCVVAYDGTAYQGWQRQADGPTIQAALEDAFVPLLGSAPVVTGAGRTDAGVHALGQVASVRVSTSHDVAAIRRALNARLPADIRVLSVSDAAPEFHARFAAVGKTYRYRIVTAEVASPFERWFVWHLPGPLRTGEMREAACAIVGTHDFSSFQALGSDVEDAVRTITRLEVTSTSTDVVIEAQGTGFLRHMVRILVGTLVDVGSGRRQPAEMTDIVAARDRRAAGDTAPARGLTLVAVDYPPGC